jgi:hypothetical protein
MAELGVLEVLNRLLHRRGTEVVSNGSTGADITISETDPFTHRSSTGILTEGRTNGGGLAVDSNRRFDTFNNGSTRG